MSETKPTPQKDWPPSVHVITNQDIARLGVGQGGQLYWDGRPVVTRSRLDLSSWQRGIAIIAAIAALAGGLGSCASGIDATRSFGCKLHWWATGCQ
jgi:hypothetical protein